MSIGVDERVFGNFLPELLPDEIEVEYPFSVRVIRDIAHQTGFLLQIGWRPRVERIVGEILHDKLLQLIDARSIVGALLQRSVPRHHGLLRVQDLFVNERFRVWVYASHLDVV